MIFKTFDSNSDRVLSKIGILGKSFEQIGASIRQRKIDIDSLMGAMSKKDAEVEVGGFWSYIFGNKSIKEKPIDLSKYIELDEPKASNLLKGLQEIEIASKSNTFAWQEYFSTLNDGQKWQIEFVKKNDLQKSSTEDLIKANQQAHASALAHNEAIKAQTLSAKAGSAALKALSIAGNMLAMWAISKGIELAATVIDNIANASKHAAESAEALASEMNDSISSMSGNASALSDLNDEYQKLSKGVNRLGENVSLSTEDYSKYKDIISQVSAIMPGLTTYFNAQGEKIAFARGELKDFNKEYDEYIKKQAKKYVTEGDSDGNKIQDILNNYNYNESLSGFNKFLKGFKASLGLTGLEDFTTKEILSELDKLKNAKSIDELRYLLNGGETALSNYNFGNIEDDAVALRKAIKDELLHLTTNEIKSMSEDDYNALIESITSYIQNYEAKISSDMNEIYTALSQVAYSKDEYWKIQDADVRNDIITFLSSINSDIWDKLNKKTENEVSTLVNTIIKSMSKNEDGFADAWNGLFDPESEDLPVSEYAHQIDNYLKTISKILGLDEKDGVLLLKVSLGFDDVDDAAERLQNAVRALADDHGMGDREIISSDEYAELLEIVNNLTKDEAELCLKAISDAKNVTDAINGIKKALEYVGDADEPQTLSSVLTSSADSLDKFQSSVKSAADAYATLLSGNYSSTELLDSIQAINQAATDMGGTLDWEFIKSQSTMDSLELLGKAIENISQDYAESVLAGAGIDVGSEFGQMLADMIRETYEAEAEFTAMNSQLDNLQSSYQTLTGILESYNETGHISLDNLQSLLTADENLIAMLEAENGQLMINQAAYENLIAAQLLEFRAKLDDAAAAEIEALAHNKSEEATNNNAKASEDAVAKLDAETEAFKRNSEAAGENAITKAIANAEEAGVSNEEIQSVLDKYTAIWNAAKDNYSADFPAFMNGAKSGASSAGEAAGKSAGEAFAEALGKELAALDKNMEAGYIDFNDYIQSRLSLIEDYYDQGKLSADEYYSYLEKHYDTQLSYMDKAVNAVTRRIDTELDALKQQKEDVESLYNVQIESLEKEKTLLEEATKERQRQKDLQRSLYDLERAKNQRTKLVYTEDKGMIYVADDQSIRDAQESVDNAGYDIKIAEIDKSISNLEEARDKETNAIDEMISNLESYKDAWNDVTSAYEEEQENLFAAQILGADWEADILNGRLDVLNDFKNQYIRIQQEMAAAAWESANEQAKAAQETEKEASGSPSKTPNISGAKDKPSEDVNPQISRTSGGGGGGSLHSLGLGSNKLSYVNLQAYGSGTNNAKRGLNLVGEDGPEAYFDNHGHVAIVAKPTLIPMEGGEVVKNERDTKKLLDPDNLVADIDGKETLSDVRTLTPISLEEYIQELRRIAPKQVQTKQIYPETDLLQSPEKCAAAMRRSLESMMNPMNLIAHNMQELTGMGTHMNHINNVSSLANNTRNAQPVINGGINVTCPGVTSKEVAKQLPGVLNEALEREFSGLHLQAMQWVK